SVHIGKPAIPSAGNRRLHGDRDRSRKRFGDGGRNHCDGISGVHHGYPHLEACACLGPPVPSGGGPRVYGYRASDAELSARVRAVTLVENRVQATSAAQNLVKQAGVERRNSTAKARFSPLLEIEVSLDADCGLGRSRSPRSTLHHNGLRNDTTRLLA